MNGKRTPKRPSIVKELIVDVREHYRYIVVPAESIIEYDRARDGHSGGTEYATPAKRTSGEWLVYDRSRNAVALLTEWHEGTRDDAWGVSLVKARDGARFEIRASIRTAPTWIGALEILTR